MTLLSFSHRAACAPLIRRGKAFFSLFLVCAGILSVSGAQLTLSWKDNSNNETGFKIERSLDGTTFSQIAAVGANTVSYTNTGLADATRYHYRVRAYNAAGNEGPDGLLENVILDFTVPGAPTGLEIVAS